MQAAQGVVAGGGRDDPSCQLGVGHREQGVAGTSGLEGAGALQILTLDVHGGGGDWGERGVVHVGVDALPGNEGLGGDGMMGGGGGGDPSEFLDGIHRQKRRVELFWCFHLDV